ncbi:MAG: hypothetical protein A2075_18275 [Geobacteraceae bacterium GWC2_58_44]|nr:MAG: hypothetical protein A2075_18275 [Geobacteraceae bacterium GWC2_58_44]
MQRLAGALMLLFALWGGTGCWSVSAAAASPPASSEYQVKAAFLYNFMKFVEWPSDGLATPGTICLGILGRDPFDDALDEFKGKLAKGRKVVVLHFRSVEEVKGCDILFICPSEKGRLSQILKLANNSRMLTVADQEGFCEAGGMINLLFIKNRVGFEVNVAAASRAKLRVSSQLLKLARNVFE